MAKFNVGDIVKGNEKSDGFYALTNQDMTRAEVVDVYKDYIDLKVLEHRNSNIVGKTYYTLNPDMFDLVDEIKNIFKVGDLITGTKESDRVYMWTDSEMKVGKVIKVINDDEIEVQVLNHEIHQVIGRTYEVESKYFKLIDAETSTKFGTDTEFEIGDIIKGTPISDVRYIYTTSRMTKAKVIGKYGKKIRIEVLEHEDPEEVGQTYTVYPEYFALVEDEKTEESSVDSSTEVGFSVGDIVTGLPESDEEYGWTTTRMNRGKVVEVLPSGLISVEILEHTGDTQSFPVGMEYVVDPEFFTLVQKTSKFNEGDKVKIISNGSQGVFHFHPVGSVGTIIEHSGEISTTEAYYVYVEGLGYQTIAVEDLELVVESDVTEDDAIDSHESKIKDLEAELRDAKAKIAELESENYAVEVEAEGQTFRFGTYDDFTKFMKDIIALQK